MKHTYFFTLLAFSSTVFGDSLSEETPIQEQTVTVANRTPVPLRELSASVSVMDEETLAQLGYVDLSSAIASMPSISVSNNGGLGKTTSLSVRGEAGFRTLVLLDGINIADPSAPQALTQFEHLSSAGVSRVEVLRGPHGLSYGADAGGVILISSTQAQESGLHAGFSVEAGSYASHNTNGNMNFKNDALAFSLSASQLQTDGFNTSTFDNTLADDDGYENTTLHGKMAAELTDNIQLQAVYRTTDGDSEYDNCYNMSFSLVHDCSSTYEQQSQRLALAISRFGEHSLAYNKSDIERNNFSEGDFSFGALGRTEKFEYNGSTVLNETNTLVFGLDDTEEALDDVDTQRSQRGAYLEYQGRFHQQTYINVGLRHDNNDDFGAHNSYRAGIAKLFTLDAANELKIKASYGTGFRAPAIYEEFTNTAFGTADMPALKEETSQGFDVGIAFYGSDNLHLELVYFEQQVDDEIYYDLVAYTGYLQGRGTSKSSGVELIAEVPVNENWAYTLNYSYTDSKEADGAVRSRQPKNSGTLGVRGSLLEGRLRLGLQLRAVADIYDAATATQQRNHQVLDAKLRFAVNDAIELFVRLENMLDKQYESVPNFYAAEAATYGGLSLRF